MAFEKSLLTRIREGDEYTGAELDIDEHQVTESVLRNLQQMLNTRQGSSSALPDYGMPDLNDVLLQLPSGIPEVRKLLKTTIEKYEPRLDRVHVKHVVDPENPLALRFEISAQLLVGEERVRIAFESILDDSGQIRVRR